MTAKYQNGTGCDIWYSSDVVIIAINVSNITITNNSVLSNVILPSNIKFTSAAQVVMGILSSSWRPMDKMAYLSFSYDNQSPTIRISDNSLSNAILQGLFAFPRRMFNIS